MIITNAQYKKNTSDITISVAATIDEVAMEVPLDLANRHYTEILKQVADGDITIAEAV